MDHCLQIEAPLQGRIPSCLQLPVIFAFAVTSRTDESVPCPALQVQLILFLNKCDILERKLARGIPINQYIASYGDRANDMPTASRCTFNFFLCHGANITERNIWVAPHADLRKQFLEIARKNSPEPRTVHSFMTTAIVRSSYSYRLHLLIPCVIMQDTRAMSKTLAVIRTSIVYDNLQAAKLIR